MKISLVTVPPESEDVYFVKPFRGCEHSGIQVLAASVEQAAHDVQVIDAATLSFSISDILTRLATFKPDVIGISSTLSSMKNSLILARRVKQWPSQPKVIMGGHHVTLCADSILTNEPDVDVIFLGEAEESLVAFLDNLENKTAINSIKGIALRQGEKIQFNGPTLSINDLDRLPKTRRDILLELKDLHPLIGTTIQSSRGCPYHCSFCTSPIFFQHGQRYRKRSFQLVADEMESVCNEFDIHLFNFTDDLFLPPGNRYKRWGLEFANELTYRQLPVAFSVMLRSDIFQPKYADMIQHLKKAGLHQVLIGMESISHFSLKKYNKGTSVRHYYSAIAFLEKLSVHLVPAFINLNPYLTRSDFIGNIVFLNEVVHAPVLYPFTSHLTVFPKTPMVKQLKKDNLLIEHDRSYINNPFYKFSDPVIQALSDGFRSVIEKPFRSDGLVEEVQHLMAHLRAIGNLSYLEYNDLFKQCRSIHTKMARTHYSVMNECLRFADRLDSKGVEKVLSDYYSNGDDRNIDLLIAVRNDLRKNDHLHKQNSFKPCDYQAISTAGVTA